MKTRSRSKLVPVSELAPLNQSLKRHFLPAYRESEAIHAKRLWSHANPGLSWTNTMPGMSGVLTLPPLYPQRRFIPGRRDGQRWYALCGIKARSRCHRLLR
jgi:hypothetical protein